MKTVGTKRKPGKGGLARRRRWAGRRFVLLWEIGFVWFVLFPLLESLTYSFSDVRIAINGFEMDFVGLEKYRYIFYESPTYVDKLTESLTSFFTSIPLIFSLSLILGIVLNQKFPGRLMFRTLFFLPVIMSTGIILEFISGNSAAAMMTGMASGEATVGFIRLSELFADIGLPDGVGRLLTRYINTIFDLMWDCGVPIVLFIAGLQAIPDSMFEAATVEGATSWERFWYVTFPALSNTSLLVLVYISIAFFTKSNNPVINQAFTILHQQQLYSISAAMLWTYFGIIMVMSAALYGIIYACWLRRLQ